MALWTPDNLSVPPAKWFRALSNDASPVAGADLTVSGRKVSNWRNRGSVAGDASMPNGLTTATDFSQPTYNATGFNGSFPVVTFTDYKQLTSPLSLSGPSVSAFAVADTAAGNGGHRILSLNNGGTDYDSVTRAALMKISNDHLATERPSFGTFEGTSSVVGPNILNTLYTTDLVQGFLNSVSEGTNKCTAGNFGSSILCISGIPDGQYPGSAFKGGLSEIILLTYIPSAAERAQIEGYLAWKYGLQAKLPSNHAYKNAAPVSAVAQIIRRRAMALLAS